MNGYATRFFSVTLWQRCVFIRVYSGDLPNGEAIVSMSSDINPTSRELLCSLIDRAAYTSRIRQLITVKRARLSNFMRRLIQLDRESYERKQTLVQEAIPVAATSDAENEHKKLQVL